MSANSRPCRNKTKKKTLFASPTGQFQRCSRTTSQTQTPPVTKPQASAMPIGHQPRYDSNNTRAETPNIPQISYGRRPNQVVGERGIALVFGFKVVAGSEITPPRLSNPSPGFTFFRFPLDMVLM